MSISKKSHSFTLIVNSSNVQNINNNTYQYNFIGGSLTIPENSEISVSSATIPYSWRNITAAYGNNTYLFYWPLTISTYQTFTIIMPDGFYTLSDINTFFQNYCITNGLYLINSTGLYQYYFSFNLNINYYGCQLISLLVPTSLPVGYTQPTNFYGFPTTTMSPGIGVVGAFSSIIGFSIGNYPSTFISASNGSYLSNITLNATPVNSLTFRCSLCSNNVSTPSDILDSMPINSIYGSNLIYNPAYEKNVSLRPGTYSNFQLYLCDQNNNLINALDSNILLTLRIIFNK